MEDSENKKREITKEKTSGRERERTCRLMGGGLITSLPPKFLVFNYYSTLMIPLIFHLAPKIT